MADTQNITAKTFPGVYTQIIDQSFLLPQTSRYRAGLIGVARKGPFDVPTAVTSLSEFIRIFGQPLSGDFFLANAVAILSDLSDGMKVVRVGKRSTALGSSLLTATLTSTGTLPSYNKALVLSPNTFVSGQSSPSVFMTVKEIGKLSTVNAQVVSAGSLPGSANAGIVTVQTPFNDLYTVASSIAYSVGAPAANAAEAFLYSYTYGSLAGSYGDADLGLRATGSKGQFVFTLSPAANYAQLTGKLIKIQQAGRATTHEARVKQALPDGTIYLENSDRQDIGFQAVPLQDQYSNAIVYIQTDKVPYIYLAAASAGDWASPNGNSDLTTGLFVKVRPGGVSGTKKFEIYSDGGLVESIDALYQGSGTNSYSGRITNISQYITVTTVATGSYTPDDAQPANYTLGYSSAATAINASVDGGASFTGGANGEGAEAIDFIGGFDTTQDRFTGMQSFIDTDSMQVDFLCCPGVTDEQAGGNNNVFPWDGVAEPFLSTDTTSVHRKMVEVARKIKAVALIDIPPGINARQAIDWHNGQGLYTGRGRIDSANGACFWNWFTISDPFTGQDKWVPPTLAALRCQAFTFDRDKPWYAASGDVRGLVLEAKTVEFEHVGDDTKQAMYGVGTGQSVNPILLDRAQIKLWGERTLQVAESKLSVIHNVVLVNFVVNNLADVARRFVFEPNDAELLVRIRLAFTQFLDQIKTERGVEDYKLVIDDSNNSADTRNRREVIVNLALIPVDSVERIFITATVNSSGADLNAVSTQ